MINFALFVVCWRALTRWIALHIGWASKETKTGSKDGIASKDCFIKQNRLGSAVVLIRTNAEKFWKDAHGNSGLQIGNMLVDCCSVVI